MRPGLFLTIGDRQLNSDYIMATEGCISTGQPGPATVFLYVDPRAAMPFAGTDHVAYVAAKGPDQSAILQLKGEQAIAFRKQWNTPAAVLTGQAGGTG